jgi:hypothetical protein
MERLQAAPKCSSVFTFAPMKEVSRLTIADLRSQPVWKFNGSDERGETLVRPVKKLPVKTLTASIVGTDVTLGCGEKVFATIGNIEVENPRLTQHFVTFAFHREDGEVFHLARYHDVDHSERGPTQLAEFLCLPMGDIFPITWDVSPFANGSPDAVRGVLTDTPQERLSRAQIIALAVP